jgi:phage FluMu protein Com
MAEQRALESLTSAQSLHCEYFLGGSMESRNQPAFPSSCDSEDYRCLCGSLMAKITPLGVEIKCRKCKRIQLIPNSQVSFDVATPQAKAVGGMF